jgi:hypothetical protein
MTEAEWLESADVIEMLKYLDGKPTDRKLRLFGCACCRRVWDLMTDRECRRAVEASEGYADGLVTEKKLEKARAAVNKKAARNLPDTWSSLDDSSRYSLALAAQSAAMWGYLCYSVTNVARYTAWARDAVEGVEERVAQCHLLRDIIGNPFRPVAIAAEWQRPDVIGLGQAISDGRAFDRLPELADALLRAGCDDAEILAHCRDPGPHVRGCWVIDSLLGRS